MQNSVEIAFIWFSLLYILNVFLIGFNSDFILFYKVFENLGESRLQKSGNENIALFYWSIAVLLIVTLLIEIFLIPYVLKVSWQFEDMIIIWKDEDSKNNQEVNSSSNTFQRIFPFFIVYFIPSFVSEVLVLSGEHFNILVDLCVNPRPNVRPLSCTKLMNLRNMIIAKIIIGFFLFLLGEYFLYKAINEIKWTSSKEKAQVELPKQEIKNPVSEEIKPMIIVQNLNK